MVRGKQIPSVYPNKSTFLWINFS